MGQPRAVVERADRHIRIQPGQALPFPPVDVIHLFLAEKMIFHIMPFPVPVDPDEGVDAEAVHPGEIPHDAPVAVQPGDLVQAFGSQGKEIPDVAVVLEIGAGIRLLGMDEIRKLDGVPDEKDGKAQSHHVVIAFGSVEFHREASRIPDGIRRALGTDDRGKADQKAGGLVGILKKSGAGVFRHAAIGGKDAERAAAFGVYHPFRDALPVEVSHFFDKLYVL